MWTDSDESPSPRNRHIYVEYNILRYFILFLYFSILYKIIIYKLY